MMKRLLTIVILIFTLQTSSQADDIRDFQIEGMSIGDSLLDYFSEEELNYEIFYYKNNKFAGNIINRHPSFKVYDDVQFVFKPEDKKYKIYNVTGIIYYDDDINNCYIKKDEIIKELRELFGNTVTIQDDGTEKHLADKLGNSTINSTQLLFNSEDIIQISCTDWSKTLTKERRWVDQLKVLMAKKEFVDFLNDEHYK